jgi:hypothetical protein
VTETEFEAAAVKLTSLGDRVEPSSEIVDFPTHHQQAIERTVDQILVCGLGCCHYVDVQAFGLISPLFGLQQEDLRLLQTSVHVEWKSFLVEISHVAAVWAALQILDAMMMEVYSHVLES